MINFPRFVIRGPLRAPAGLSLIELLVALAIGALLLLGVSTIVVNSSRSHRDIAQLSEQLENGRYAIQSLTRELKHAGYLGELGAIPAFSDTTLPNPCETVAADLAVPLQLAVQGYDAPADGGTGPLDCLADGNHLGGTDILVVRRTETSVVPLADPTAVTAADLTAGEIYMQTLPTGFRLDSAADPTVFDLTKKSAVTPAPAANLRKYRVDIYYVSPCSTAAGTECAATDDGGTPIPTLKRLSLTQEGGTTQFKSEPLVEGIEDLQFDWGIDASGDGAPNDYVASPSVDQWRDVVAVRAYVLARNMKPSSEYQDNQTYSLGESGDRTFSGDAARYKRHLFSSVVRLVNVSSRREE